jgi:methylmalonyl-CoA/ethylmalonyl-CoA epimerase
MTSSSLPGLPADSPPFANTSHLDHIGIATDDLAAGIKLYRDLLGFQLERIEEVPSQQVRVAFLKMDPAGTRGHLELLAPLSAESPIAKFLSKRGPGLHHIAVGTTDLEAVLKACRAAGLPLLDEQPRPGAGGKQIAFLHPKAANGVLVEICGPTVPEPGNDP